MTVTGGPAAGRVTGTGVSTGAAGLLVWHDGRVLLQHRGLGTQHGGTWGIVGGARNRGETAVQAAFREAAEEAGLHPAAVTVTGRHDDDHGGWTYTTVIGRAAVAVPLTGFSAETIEMRWVSVDDLDSVPLHPGFAASWPQVSRSGRYRPVGAGEL